jgi:predicted GNAT family acetyltransferase
MYRLDQVVSPVGVRGRLRHATEQDLPTAHQWADDFARDAGHEFMTPPAARERWIRQGELYFWEVQGSPTAMAVATGWTENGARIGYVFTPRGLRGNGYASAITAAVSQRILEGGRRFCVLYTDATSPVPNAIYPRVGYRLLTELEDVKFS